MHIVDQIDELTVPDDIVVFRTATRRFALNAHLASWTLLTEQQDALLGDLARGVRPQPGGSGLFATRRDLDRALAHLVLNYLAYMPGWTPGDITPQPRLNVVYYAITDGCNLRCPYCYDSSLRKLPGELKHEESMRLMEQIAATDAKTVVFTGGEPMMRRDLFDVVRRARELGLKTNIISNGTYIRTPEIAETMAEIFDRVTISVDGGTLERHEATRGKGTFAKVIRGLTLLNAAGVTPVINHVVTSDNVDHMHEVAGLGDRFRIKHIRVQHHSDLGRGKDDHLSFEWDDYMKTDSFMWTEPNAKYLMDDSLKAVKPCNIKGNCGMGGNEIYVNSLGSVYPCKLVTGLGNLAGNIRETPLNELFEAPNMKELRDSSVFGGSVHTDCERCYIKGACGGGCRAFHMARSGDLSKNSRALCRILRHSQISTIWRALGADRQLIEDPGAFVPIRPADGSVHPAYEDWRGEQAAPRLLPIVGVSA